MRTLDAIATEAARSRLLGHPAAGARSDARPVSGAYQRLSEQAVDGAIIIFEAHLLDEAEFTLPPGCPSWSIDSSAGHRYTVSTPTRRTAPGRPPSTCSARTPAGLAHRRPRLVLGRRRPSPGRARCSEAGIEPPPVLRGDWTTESGYRHGLTLGRARRRDRHLRRQRPDGARPDAGAARARPGRARRHQHRRLRRHGGGALVLAAADHDPPGLRRGRPAEHPQAAAEGVGGGDRERQDLVPTELIVRNSTAPPLARQPGDYCLGHVRKGASPARPDTASRAGPRPARPL